MSQVVMINGQPYEVNPDGTATPVSKPGANLGSIAQPLINYGLHEGINALAGSSGAEAAAQAAAAAEASGSAASAGGSVAGASSGLGAIAPWLGAAAALHGGYGLVSNFGHLGHMGGALSGAETGAGIGTMIAPGPGTLIGGGIGALGGLAASLFDHKSTKQFEQERWGALANQGDDTWKKQVAAQASASHPAGDTGQNWTPEMAAAAIKDPTKSWGSVGMMSTFGPDYFSKMNEFQRYAATQYAIDHNLLKNDHGDITVTDPAMLKAALKDFTSNKDYEKAFNAWKKANPKEITTQSPVTGSTPATAKINLSALMPKSDGKAERAMQVQNVLNQNTIKGFQPIKVGASLKGLMPSNFGTY